MLLHDVINLLFYEHWTDKRKYFYVHQNALRGHNLFKNHIKQFIIEKWANKAEYLAGNSIGYAFLKSTVFQTTSKAFCEKL